MGSEMCIRDRFNRAYTDLLLPKFAVYWSEENLERYKDIVIPEGSKVYSSESARVFQSFYSKRVFDVRMNLYEPWTIEPWHIRATLRSVAPCFLLHLSKSYREINP